MSATLDVVGRMYADGDVVWEGLAYEADEESIQNLGVLGKAKSGFGNQPS
jgi:hypothetical protein